MVLEPEACQEKKEGNRIKIDEKNKTNSSEFQVDTGGLFPLRHRQIPRPRLPQAPRLIKAGLTCKRRHLGIREQARSHVKPRDLTPPQRGSPWSAAVRTGR